MLSRDPGFADPLRYWDNLFRSFCNRLNRCYDKALVAVRAARRNQQLRAYAKFEKEARLDSGTLSDPIHSIGRERLLCQ
jgi:sterol desaturase/sphingolipid hydroxylase (fatty acid hydroxylase superfamily)